MGVLNRERERGREGREREPGGARIVGRGGFLLRGSECLGLLGSSVALMFRGRCLSHLRPFLGEILEVLVAAVGVLRFGGLRRLGTIVPRWDEWVGLGR